MSNKISPDIARRASWITRRQSETESSVPSTAQSPSISRRTTCTTITLPSGDETSGEIEKITAKRAIELDALLNALSSSKAEVKELKDEVTSLHKLLEEGLNEKGELRQRNKDLVELVDQLEGSKRRSLGLKLKGAELSTDGESIHTTID